MENKIIFKFTNKQFHSLANAMLNCNANLVDDVEKQIMARALFAQLLKRIVNRLDHQNKTLLLTMKLHEAIAFSIIFIPNIYLLDDYQHTIVLEMLAKINQACS